MTFLPTSAKESAWTLHVAVDLGHVGTLIYAPDGETLFAVSLRPSWTSLMLALAVSREIDLRSGARCKVGCRSLEHLGRMFRLMPGTGHRVESTAVASYKTSIVQLVRAAVARLARGQRPGYVVPAPVEHPGYNDGYRIIDEGVAVVGLDLDALVDLVCA